MSTMKQNRIKSTVRVLAVTSLAALAVVGCAGNSVSNTEPETPTTRFPIEVSRETVSVVIKIPMDGTNAMVPEDARRLKTFINDFVVRGRSQIMVETQMGDLAREYLQAQGIRAHEIHVVGDTTLKAPNAALSFTANVANVPECGDWSESNVFTPNNNPHSNFGCANRRNTGLSVADPGDLIDSQPISPSRAGRHDTKMDSYNAGEPINPVQQQINPNAVSGTN